MDSLSTRNGPTSPANSPRGLAAGTLVTTPDGDKKIEEIKAGDLVLSGVGKHKTGFFEVRKVSAKFNCGPMLRINHSRSNNHFCATSNHICFGWPSTFSAPPIADGWGEDVIALWAFEKSQEGDIEHRVHKEGYEFFMGERETPIECFKSLDEAEFSARKMSQAIGGAEIERRAYFTSTMHFNFMPASNLKVVMRIPVVENSLVKNSTITTITEEQYDGLVYDLDVPEARNFAANGVLVHDSTS